LEAPQEEAGGGSEAPEAICQVIAQQLASLTALQHLSLYEMVWMSSSDVAVLAQLPQLTSLCLEHCCLGMDGVPPGLALFTALRHLQLSYQTLRGDGGLWHLSRLGRLTKLMLTGSEGLRRLPAQLTDLSALEVGAPSSWIALKGCPLSAVTLLPSTLICPGG
jgi:hypothetical protein